jgi:hypothetical protein
MDGHFNLAHLNKKTAASSPRMFPEEHYDSRKTFLEFMLRREACATEAITARGVSNPSRRYGATRSQVRFWGMFPKERLARITAVMLLQEPLQVSGIESLSI